MKLCSLRLLICIIGPNLQDALVEYDKSTTFKSYIEEFWNDSYLVPEGSVLATLGLILQPHWFHTGCSQSQPFFCS